LDQGYPYLHKTNQLHCPRAGRKIEDEAEYNSTTTYWYQGGLKYVPDATGVVVVMDAEHNHREYGNVLFMGGEVRKYGKVQSTDSVTADQEWPPPAVRQLLAGKGNPE
jgi:hypothetical protein